MPLVPFARLSKYAVEELRTAERKAYGSLSPEFLETWQNQFDYGVGVSQHIERVLGNIDVFSAQPVPVGPGTIFADMLVRIGGEDAPWNQQFRTARIPILLGMTRGDFMEEARRIAASWGGTSRQQVPFEVETEIWRTYP